MESKWIERNNNDNADSNHSFVSDTIQEPSNSLLRNEAEFRNPTPHPNWHYVYNNDKDRAMVDKQLILESHLPPDVKRRIRSFVEEYFDVF